MECSFCKDVEDERDDYIDIDEDSDCHHFVTEWIDDPEFFLDDSQGIVNWMACSSLISSVDGLYCTLREVKEKLEEGSPDSDTDAALRARIGDLPSWYGSLVESGTEARFLVGYGGTLYAIVKRVPGIEVADEDVGGVGTSCGIKKVLARDPDEAESAIERELKKMTQEIDDFESKLTHLLRVLEDEEIEAWNNSLDEEEEEDEIDEYEDDEDRHSA